MKINKISFTIAIVLIAMIVCSCLALALSSVVVRSPQGSTIVRGAITLNATTDTAARNVTFHWINSSGAIVYSQTVINNTADDTTFENVTFSTVLVADGVYTLRANATNNTGVVVTNTSTSITVDNRAPGVTAINSPTNGANLTSGSQLFNFTIADATLTVDTVRVNITNGSSAVLLSLTKPGGANYWSTTYNISLLKEQLHTIRVLANDTAGNLNNTRTFTFRSDRTAPTMRLRNSSFNTTVNARPTVHFNFTDAVFATTTCRLYFNDTAVNTSIKANNTNTLLRPSANIADGAYRVRINCTDGSGNVGASSQINVRIDAAAPVVSLNSPENGTFHGSNFTFNVTVRGSPTTVRYRIENRSNSSHVIAAYAAMTHGSGDLWTATINTAGIADQKYVFRVNATDSLNRSNTTFKATYGIDDVPPSILAFSCEDVRLTDDQDCTCTAADNGSVFGGSVTTDISTADTSSGGTKTVSCTATDSAGNTDSQTAEFRVTGSGGGSGGGGGGGSSSGSKEQQVWTAVTPGIPTTMNVRDDDLGVTSIKLDILEEARNVRLTVQEVAQTPSTVGALPSSKVYKKLQLSLTSGGVSVQAGASIDFKVEKSWLASQGLANNDIALFRYHENEWNELSTRVVSQDAAYVHYAAQTPGFSYFAIAQRQAEVEAAPVTAQPTASDAESEIQSEEGQAPAQDQQTSQDAEVQATPERPVKSTPSSWPVIVAVVLIVLAIGFVVMQQQKKKRK